MGVGERLRQLRGIRTLEEFSEPLKVGGANISHIENGRSKLSLDLAIEIATYYQVSTDWLLLGVGEMKFSQSVASEPPGDYISIPKDEYIALLKSNLREEREKVQRLRQ